MIGKDRPPAGNPQMFNRYTYVHGDPINRRDFRGLWSEGDVMLDPIADDDGGGGGGGVDTPSQDLSGDPNSGGSPDNSGDPSAQVGDLPVDTSSAANVAPLTPETPPPDDTLNFGNLVGQALVALLNPDCAALFGGLQNAVQALANSSYNTYIAGQANPYPNQIPSDYWAGAVENFQDPTKKGVTFPFLSKPGGITFFGNGFSSLDPGFGTSAQPAQMTGFLHELEHATGTGTEIDVNYSQSNSTINTKCTPSPVDTQSVPISQTLDPPS